MLRCPDCGEDENIIEKTGLLLSLYTCKVCGCEFRDCESEQVSDLWEKLDKIEDEVYANDDEIDRVKIECARRVNELDNKNGELLKERVRLFNKICELRQVWKDKLRG